MNPVNEELLEAIRYFGDLESIRHLIEERGANVNCSLRENQRSALWCATESHLLDVVEYLIQKGAQVNQADHPLGRTPLFMAATTGQLHAVKALYLDGGANVDIATTHGRTPLCSAIDMGHLDIATYLVTRANAAIDVEDEATGQTEMFFAARENHVDMVQLLVERGANAHHVAKDGTTPLHVACQEGHLELVEYLVEQAEQPINSDDEDDSEVVNVLDYPKHENGMTPLCTAIQEGHVDVAKYLINHAKGRINFQHKTTIDNRTPLMIASEHGHHELVQLLVQQGAASSPNPARRRKFRTTVHAVAGFRGTTTAFKYGRPSTQERILRFQQQQPQKGGAIVATTTSQRRRGAGIVA